MKKSTRLFSTRFDSLLFSSEGLNNFRKRFDYKPKIEDAEKCRELYAAAEIAGVTANLVNCTKQELKNYFTVEEAILICECLNGSCLEKNISIKYKMYIEIADYIKYSIFEYEVDTKELLKKVANLTEFQCFVVFTMTRDFYGREDNRFTDEDVKKIFNIEK